LFNKQRETLVAFDPFREARSNLIGEPDVIQVPIYIDIRTEDSVPVVMIELLIDTINAAAIGADLDTYGQFHSAAAQVHGGALPGVTELEMERNRLLITSMRRGSIVIAGTILAGFAWAFKKFIEPGWDKSETKKHWDHGVAKHIDFYSDRLGHHIQKLWGRTKWLRIADLSKSHDEHGPKLLMRMEENPLMKEHRPKD
jgi:hypothetical protein